MRLIEPSSKGIEVSKRRLVVVQGGAPLVDFYHISLSTKPESPVVISIRANLGAVAVRPDTLQFKPNDYHQPRQVVVLTDSVASASQRGCGGAGGGGASEEIDLLHYVTSQSEDLDSLFFKSIVYVVESGAGADLLKSFGHDESHQLGRGGKAVPKGGGVGSPQPVRGLPVKGGVAQLAGGVGHSCAVMTDGTVYAWGDGSRGQTGLLASKPPPAGYKAGGQAPNGGGEGEEEYTLVAPAPSLVNALEREFVVQVACGAAHTLVLTVEGKVFAFGHAAHGRLGLPASRLPLIERQPAGDIPFSHPATPHRHSKLTLTLPHGASAVTMTDPSPASAGRQSFVHQASILSGIDVLGTERKRSIAAQSGVEERERGGERGKDALDDVYVWKPTLIPDLHDVTHISCGKAFSACIGMNRALYTWGEGASGALGTGDCKDYWTPQCAKGPKRGFLQVACGRFHLVALSVSGEVYSTGAAEEGRLGLGDVKQRRMLTKVWRIPLCRLIASGGAHSGAIDEELNVWVWGSNNCGQLGVSDKCDHPNIHNQCVPRKLEFFKGKGVCSLSFGASHSCALTLFGLLYTWGSHEWGQLGHPFRPDRPENQVQPQLVEDLLLQPVVQVAACESHTFVASAFVHTNINKPKFDAWKAKVRAADEAHRRSADVDFRDLLEDERRHEAKIASIRFSTKYDRWLRGKETFRQRQRMRQDAAREMKEQDAEKAASPPSSALPRPLRALLPPPSRESAGSYGGVRAILQELKPPHFKVPAPLALSLRPFWDLTDEPDASILMDAGVKGMHEMPPSASASSHPVSRGRFPPSSSGRAPDVTEDESTEQGAGSKTDEGSAPDDFEGDMLRDAFGGELPTIPRCRIRGGRPVGPQGGLEEATAGREVTLFDMPQKSSYSTLLVGFMRPSEVVRASAAGFHLSNLSSVLAPPRRASHHAHHQLSQLQTLELYNIPPALMSGPDNVMRVDDRRKGDVKRPSTQITKLAVPTGENALSTTESAASSAASSAERYADDGPGLWRDDEEKDLWALQCKTPYVSFFGQAFDSYEGAGPW
ncbi:unnamed protein product [Vitrella brassicaformis CCMP3155]|uniref:RCC1-like domain-containing protein n=3 Tax=Vitrella brassicaformis TaxID=1169539 RepID=A0A0G4F366_VITBC|nr:unnamed protein product [Vitrella brassicaformis CCMP3155]|eukprot:CEM06494.1 unnamed protein product [Vitrella brassicaformis CCMP3155]